jgi:hypothetical protein
MDSVRNWVKEKIWAMLAAVLLLGTFIWTQKEEARLDLMFASGIEVDTTTATIEFVPAGWWFRQRWYARYRTHEGDEIRARFWPRHEYPRNPYHAEEIEIGYLKDEVEQFRWIYK